MSGFNVFNINDNKLRGDKPTNRFSFANNSRMEILKRAKQAININKNKKMRNDKGAFYPFNRVKQQPQGSLIRMPPTALSINNYSIQQGSGRYTPATRNKFTNLLGKRKEQFEARALAKQGLTPIKEESKKNADILGRETNYVKMMNEIIALFSDGDYKEIKLEYIRNTYSQLKADYNQISKEDLIKKATFIASYVRFYFEGSKTFIKNVGRIQTRVEADVLSTPKLLVLFKILNLSVIILGNKNKSDAELKMIIDASSKMLNSPKKVIQSRELFEKLKNELSVNIPEIDLTDTIEEGLSKEINKETTKKQIGSVSQEVRKQQTSNRQRDKRRTDDYQKTINAETKTHSKLEELKIDRLEELLNEAKLNRIPDNTFIKVFGKTMRVATFLTQIKKIITNRKKRDKTEINKELRNLEKAIYEDDFIAQIARNIIRLLQNPLIENENFTLEGDEFNAEELTDILEDMIKDEEETDSDYSF